MWTRDAAVTEFPLTWQEALELVAEMNETGLAGYRDWHLPNRRELFSLISHSRINPAVAGNRVFENIFHGYYWTSTSCARLPTQAWYVHLGGAKVYRGMKYASYMVWPVRVEKSPASVFQTGQLQCFDSEGRIISCENTGQDGQLRIGKPWPKPRFIDNGGSALDRLTGLTWLNPTQRRNVYLSWYEAQAAVEAINREKISGFNDWRIPGIRELESLVDLSAHTPALAADHPFKEIGTFYWSATTSEYETSYAWALYLQDGAIGVGYKANAEFCLWPVRG
jgi:hypothetical protein